MTRGRERASDFIYINSDEVAQREPNDGVEAELLALQRRSDSLGIELARQVILDLGAASDGAATQILEDAARAKTILEAHPPRHSEERPGFSARYAYEAPWEPGNPKILPRLVYPIDSLCHSAYIEGDIQNVQPVLVRQPSLRGEGALGYRVCAAVNATRVMGGEFTVPLSFYVPVGEIYSEGPSYEQGSSDCIDRQ